MRFGIGLWCLQSSAASPRHHAQAYHHLVEDAVIAERLGFESLWLSEHHFFYDGYCPALLTAAAHALAHTTTLRIGTGMLLLPYQDPERVTRAAIDVGRRSGGRLDFGVGLGYRDVEFEGKGISRRSRVPRQERTLDLVDTAAGQDTLVVWGGAQTEVGVRRAGARGYPILLSGALPLPLATDLVAAHREAWEQAGRPGGTPPTAGALRNVWVTDDPHERTAVLDWQRASYVLYAGLGWSVDATGANDEMDFARATDVAVQAAVDTTIIGPASEVIDGLHQVGAAGIDYVVFRIGLEGAPRSAIHSVMRRLSTEVVPAMTAVRGVLA